MVEVTGLDPAARRLATADGPVAYDHLILAVGGETNYFGLENVPRHGFGLKDVPDAIRIRNHVLRQFERPLLEPHAPCPPPFRAGPRGSRPWPRDGLGCPRTG